MTRRRHGAPGAGLLRAGGAIAAVVLACVAAQPGDAAAASSSPEAFMARVVALTVQGRYGAAWDLLHPAHQAIVPRATFETCRRNDPTLETYRFLGAALLSKQIVRIDSPGVAEHTASRVVLRFRVRDAKGKQWQSDAQVRAVWTGSRWAWVLPDADIPWFRAGRCPA